MASEAGEGSGPEVSTTVALVLGLVAAVVLAGAHLAAGRLRELPGVPERVLGSFAGGVSIAYVFLHLLPEVVEGQEQLAEALEGGAAEESVVLGVEVFGVTALGFVVYYLLERMAERHGAGADADDDDAAAAAADGAAGGHGTTTAQRAHVTAARVHVGAFAVYNGVITYTMATRFQVGVSFAVLFAAAMAVHFVLTDRGIQENYGDAVARRSRVVLAAALLGGWALSAVLPPTEPLAVSLVLAFLAGSVLFNVFKEELPDAARASAQAFAVGFAGYAVLLVGLTLLHG